MRIADLEDKALPLFCPHQIRMGGGGCGARYIGGRNLHQDTDGTVNCTNCGVIIGVFKIGMVPFRRSGIYAIQKENG